MFMVTTSLHDACSKIWPYNIEGVWPHLGDMPTPFLCSVELHPHDEDRPTNLHNYSFN